MPQISERQPIDTPQVQSSEELCGLDWIRSKKWPCFHSDAVKSYSLVDLFSGCGGLSLGVWEAIRFHGGCLDIKMALDISSQALAVYQKNFGLSDSQIVNKDISALVTGDLGEKLNTEEALLKEQFKGLDILVAGPPCQGHSDLNNQTRRLDPRNALYLKVIRFVEIARPKVVIIENVSTVIHDKGQALTKSQKALEIFGYHTQEICVNAIDFGIPQKRKRHLLLGFRSEKTFDFSFEISKANTPNLASYIWELMDEYKTKKGIFYTPSEMSKENQKRVKYLFEKNEYNLPDEYRPACHKNKKHSYISMYGRLNWEKPAQTITSGFGSMGQGRYIHPSRMRVLTPHEVARIQGFPDFFDFTIVTARTVLHEMLGNAVPPKIAATFIAKFLKEKIL
jgi:DNA (cytosine-5)-methyltransferase 1